jgi:hypothetical protein
MHGNNYDNNIVLPITWGNGNHNNGNIIAA